MLSRRLLEDWVTLPQGISNWIPPAKFCTAFIKTLHYIMHIVFIGCDACACYTGCHNGLYIFIPNRRTVGVFLTHPVIIIIRGGEITKGSGQKHQTKSKK